MKTLKLVTVVSLILLGVGITAQNKTNLFYSMGVPMGETKDYIEKTSFRGMGIEFEKEVMDNLGVGGLIAWNTFYEAIPEDTYPLTNGAITGKQFRYLNTLPIMATASYYLASEEQMIRPYLGMGLGTYWIEQRTDMGLYSDVNKSWHFGLAPKAGIMVPISFSTSMYVGLNYNIAFKTSKLDQQSWLGINVGFSFDY
jgi:outer membrane protein